MLVLGHRGMLLAQTEKSMTQQETHSLDFWKLNTHRFRVFLEATCLKRDVTGQLSLKRNHDYYYQVLGDMAYIGIEECEFFV